MGLPLLGLQYAFVSIFRPLFSRSARGSTNSSLSTGHALVFFISKASWSSLASRQSSHRLSTALSRISSSEPITTLLWRSRTAAAKSHKRTNLQLASDRTPIAARYAGSVADTTYTCTNRSAFVPQMGQASGALPSSMCPQTGQR